MTAWLNQHPWIIIPFVILLLINEVYSSRRRRSAARHHILYIRTSILVLLQGRKDIAFEDVLRSFDGSMQCQRCLYDITLCWDGLNSMGYVGEDPESNGSFFLTKLGAAQLEHNIAPTDFLPVEELEGYTHPYLHFHPKPLTPAGKPMLN